MKVAIYARFSSEKQSDGYSIEAQLGACRKVLAPGEHHFTEYVDRARSGCTIAGRPGLLRLLADAETGRIDLLLVYKYDRLGRNQAETASTIQTLEEVGVKVRSATEGEDPLARGIHLVIGEHYLRQLSERTRAGVIKAAEHGRVGGPAPYGYHRDDAGCLIIDEATAPTVRRMFREYVEGSCSLKTIARKFNAEGIASPRGGEWHSPSIHEMLSNELYAGRRVFNRRKFRRDRRTGRRVYSLNPEAEWLTQEQPGLAIVSRDMWEQTQMRRAKRASSKAVRRHSYPLSGLVVCGKCGAKYVAQPSRNSKGRYVFMTCGNRQSGGTCNNSFRFRLDLILSEMIRTVMREFLTPEATDELKDILWQYLEDEFRKGRDGRREDEATLQSVREKLRHVMDLMLTAKAKGDGTEALWQDQLAQLQRERLAIEERLRKASEASAFDRGRLSSLIDKAAKELREGIIPKAAPEQIRDVLRAMIGNVTAHPDATLTGNTQPAGALHLLQRVACSSGSGGRI